MFQEKFEKTQFSVNKNNIFFLLKLRFGKNCKHELTLLKCSYATDISIKNYVGLSRNLNLKHHFHPYIRRGHLIVKQRGITCLKFMTFETIKKMIFLKVFL